ncbi:hypothetical protein [Streptomyces sp. NPDC058108]|uniref:hypothetical protein n=1 Tax=Streptomyces sp. NPDC058108 TaxID=3346344 RepID=UPI0036F113B6
MFDRILAARVEQNSALRAIAIAEHQLSDARAAGPVARVDARGHQPSTGRDLLVSYSPSIYKFLEGGDMPVPLDMDVVRAVLSPHDVGDPQLTVLEDGHLQYWIRAADGSEAEIFADESGISVERPHSGSGVFAIVAELAARLQAVIIEPSEGVFLCGTEAHAHLPANMREEAVLIEMTGEALEAALIGPRHS